RRGARTRSLPQPTICWVSLIACTNLGIVSRRRVGRNQSYSSLTAAKPPSRARSSHPALAHGNMIPHILYGCSQILQQAVDRRTEQPAFGCQFHLARTAFEKPGPQLVFEGTDKRAESGLSLMAACRRTREMHLFRQRGKSTQ